MNKTYTHQSAFYVWFGIDWKIPVWSLSSSMLQIDFCSNVVVFINLLWRIIHINHNV